MIPHDTDITGQYIVLKRSALDERFRDMDWRVVRCTGGFGAKPGLGGTAVFVQFHDGDEGRFSIGQVDRLATVGEIHRFAHLWTAATGEEMCVFGADCPTLEDHDG